MSHRMARLAVPMLVAIAAVAQNGAAQGGGAPAQTAAYTPATAASRAADAQAIRALDARWLAAQRSKDVNALMPVYAPDAVAFYGGTLFSNSAAIRAHYEQDFASSARPGLVPSWETTAIDVAQSGDVAYETGTYDDSWNGGKDHERGHYLTVWRKVGGQWKVARDFAAPTAAASPAAKPKP